MPEYRNRDELVADENVMGGSEEVMSMYGANQIIEPKQEEEEKKNDLIGGMLSDIMDSKKPHKKMIRSILKMKPQDIHIVKRSARYFLDNPHELKNNIDEGILEDLSQTTGSNDLADMLDQDYEDTQGGDLEENPDNLLEGLAILLHHIPKITKALNQ